MVVEGVASAPVDEFHIGIGQSLAVVVERLARVEEHLGDVRDGDEAVSHGFCRWGAMGHLRRSGAFAHVAHGAVAEAEAAAREPDLAEHRCERQSHPGRLLAVVDALQRPGDVISVRPPPCGGRATRIVSAGMPDDGLSPLGCLGCPVGVAAKVALEASRSRQHKRSRNARSCSPPRRGSGRVRA